jgi:exodeoxyribonuclease VII large subunit
MTSKLSQQPPSSTTFSGGATNESLTVSALVQQARAALERAIPLQWVSGEVSGFKRAASGHCYFDLKDSSAQVSCVLYRNRAALIGVEIKDGAQVELRLRPSIYEPRGSLQFTVEQARLAGVGRLYEAFLRLKAQLEQDGVFDAEKKRALPKLPTTIGLITSPQAAALADMLRILRDRWPSAKIILYPASVQGSNAPGELLSALNTANRRAECDVLIIGRGGGSIEDLWAFNDEALVRAVATSSIPMVSAVGHETDFTLCDFAADARAPTPTAAATMVTPERRALIVQLERLGMSAQRAFQRKLETLAQRLDRTHERLRSSDRALAPWKERLLSVRHRLARALHLMPLESRQALSSVSTRYTAALREMQALRAPQTQLREYVGRLNRAVGARLVTEHHSLDKFAQAMMHLNPQHVLDRGYAVILDRHGKAITDASSLAQGELVQASVKHGSFDAQVVATRNTNQSLD